MTGYRQHLKQERMRTEQLRAVGLVLMLFGVVALVTSAFFLAGAGARQLKGLPPEGGTLGPIVVTAKNTLLQVSVFQPLVREGWSYIEGEVLSEAGSVLLRFGGELWRESGVDSEGAWSEADADYELRILVTEPGTYHIAFEAETGHVGMMSTVPPGEIAGAMHVSVQPLKGSPVPFRTAGLLALIIGFLLHEMATGAVSRLLARSE